MSLTGNKGEWSELYALVKLLSEGKLYAADENTQRLNDIYFPIIKIMRNERNDKCLDFLIRDGLCVEVYRNNEFVRSIDKERLQAYADYLYRSICNGSNRAFSLDESENIMGELECEKLKAPSTDKADITMQVHDIHTGYEPICGFSIKSELGNAPTLLNASKATNFVFCVSGISDEEATNINAIDTREKIKDRIATIVENGTLSFVGALNDTFASNLMLIDSRMEEMMGHILLKHYISGENNCERILEQIEGENPMGFPRRNFYKYKFKKLLCSIALGMVPSREWDGIDDANGGYIIVTETGDCLAYHLYNRDAFEDYLLKNARFERASTSRHDFASIYERDGQKYINLNLQIRFS